MVLLADPVAITGIGGRYPRSADVDEFWENLLSGQELCTDDELRMPKDVTDLPPKAGKIPGIEKFDADFFGMSHNIANLFDPQFKICHETTFGAVVDAGLDPADLSGSRTGMFIGYCYSDTWVAQTEEGRTYESVWDESFSAVSKFFGFMGPCATYDSAFASSFSAFNEAVKSIEANVIDTAIVSGVTIAVNTRTASCFRMLGMTSAEGESRCMDKNANGYVRSETISSLVLQRKSASKRIYATVVNTMTNSDGYKRIGITYPGRLSMIRLMKKTYEEVGMDPKDTKYVEAHVTGTQAGDPIECRAIEKVFCPPERTDSILVGALKSNMGHAEGASGVAALTKACLIMQRSFIPPNIHFKDPNPNIPGLFNGKLKPVVEVTPFHDNIISLNSFGFGGSNIHSIIKRSDENLNSNIDEITGNNGMNRLILWKARSEKSFEILKNKLMKSPDKITTEYLALLKTVSNLDSKWDLPYRGYFVLNNKKEMVECQWLKIDRDMLSEKNNLILETGLDTHLDWVKDVLDTLGKVGFKVTVSAPDDNKQTDTITIYQYHQNSEERQFTISPETYSEQTISLIGQLYMSGSQKVNLDGLYPQVKFPVSHSTSSLSPLITWNHDHDWTVYRAPEYFTGKSCKKRFHFDYGGFFHDLSGHKIDGRQIFPAAGYLASVWQSFAFHFVGLKPYSYLDTGGIFRDVKLHRAILVEPGEEINFLVGVNPFTGFFEINQKDVLLVTGYFMLTRNQRVPTPHDVTCGDDETDQTIEAEKQTNANEQNGDQNQPDHGSTDEITNDKMISKKEFNEELRVRGYNLIADKTNDNASTFENSSKDQITEGNTVDTLISKKEFYKELRVRGYDYEGEFQGVSGCNPDGTGGVVTFRRNCVFFIDSVFQLALINDPTRQLLLPTGFEHIEIDGSVFKPCATNELEKFKNIIYSTSVDDTEFDEDKDEESGNIKQDSSYRGNDDKGEIKGKESSDVGMAVQKVDDKKGGEKESEGKKDNEDTDKKESEVDDIKEYPFKVIIKKATREIFTDGLYIKGMNATSAPRRKPKPYVMDSNFRPFDDITDIDIKEVDKRDEYAKQCLALIRGEDISEGGDAVETDVEVTEEGKKQDTKKGKEGNENEEKREEDIKADKKEDDKEEDKKAEDKEVDKKDEDKKEEIKEFSLLNTMKEFRKDKKEISVEKLREHSAKLSTDLLIQVPETDSLRHQFQIITSCYSNPSLEITEINLASKSNLKKTIKTFVQEAFCAGTEYTLYTDNDFKEDEIDPMAFSDVEAIGKVGNDQSDDKEKDAEKGKDRRSIEDYLKETKISSELIVLQHPSLGFSFLETADTAEDKEQKLTKVFESLSGQMQPKSFVLVIMRKDPLTIEKEISTECYLNLSDEKKMVNLITSSGLILISTKITGSFVSILARKVEKKVENDSTKPQIFKIDRFKYDWVDELRQKIFVKETEDGKEISKPTNEDPIWIMSHDNEINGVVGFIKCIRYEDARFHGIVFMDDSKCDEELIIEKCFQLDLPLTVHKDGNLGTIFLSNLDTSVRTDRSNHVVQLNEVDENANVVKGKCDTSSYCLDIESKGDLSSLKYHEIQLPDSEDNIEVHYSALNFKDIMVALGRVPLTAYPASMSIQNSGDLGMEFSGVNKKGEAVMGVCPTDGIATKVNLGKGSEFLYKIPDWMSLEDAATIPVAYITVYYALIMRGKLQDGESILIHAGSGGVGQAAINVCLSMGCEIFTTVGTKEKREFIKKQFPSITDDHIFDSRSVSFGDDLLRATNGRGVDVILNSLSEEKLQRSLDCLAENGRFLEIGKYDMVINNTMDPVVLTRNQSFHSVCVANLMEKIILHESEEKAQGRHPDANILRDLMNDGIERKITKPLSRHIFDKVQAEEAFRFMANGKHVGKVVIKMSESDENSNTDISDKNDDGTKNEVSEKKCEIKITRKRVSFDPDKTYVVIGGLGGIGLELCYWMVRKDARKLVITSRTGIRTVYHKFCIERMKFFGAEVHVETKDVRHLDQAEDLIKFANSIGPVGGIFNLGMVIKDAMFADQTQEMFQTVCDVKVKGTFNLDKVTRSNCPNLDHFVCFSSMVSAIGNGGQSNYGYANSFMDMLCTRRRAEGLPGLAIGFGAVGDVGHVAENMGHDTVVKGSSAQRINSCFDIIEQTLHLGHPCVSTFVPVQRISFDLEGDILAAIYNVLGIKDPSKVDPKSTLGDLGLDSLMAVEIKQILEKKHNKIMSTKEIREMTVQQIKDMQKEMKSKGKKLSDGLKELDQGIELSVPTKVLELRNGGKEGEPIFVLPPIEGTFEDMKEMMKKLSEKVKRPLIGINWTKSNDPFDSIEEVAAFYMEQISESYPSLKRLDVIAYSFGSLAALEMALQRQKKGDCINKFIILDFSPKFGRLYSHEGNYTKGEGITFAERASKVFKQGIKDKKVDYNEKITKIPQHDPKWVKWLETGKKRTGNKYKDEDIVEAMERMRKKYKMCYDYQPMELLNRDVLLIRASDSIKVQNDQSFDHDYDLSKHVSGKVKVMKFDGDHKTFIINNSQAISDEIAGYLNSE